jgi:hypothetical protein
MTIGAGWYLVHEIFAAFVRMTEEDAGEQPGRGTRAVERLSVHPQAPLG